MEEIYFMSSLGLDQLVISFVSIYGTYKSTYEDTKEMLY